MHKHAGPPHGPHHDSEHHHDHSHDGPPWKRRGRGRGGRGGPPGGGGMFSVKRPLRFLMHKLDLDEDQVIAVADALSDFRIERDQADVERRRAKKVLVGALKGDEFDEEKAAQGVKKQLEANERLHEAFVDSLKRVHEVLSPQQREKLAFLLGSLDFEV